MKAEDEFHETEGLLMIDTEIGTLGVVLPDPEVAKADGKVVTVDTKRYNLTNEAYKITITIHDEKDSPDEYL